MASFMEMTKKLPSQLHLPVSDYLMNLKQHPTHESEVVDYVVLYCKKYFPIIAYKNLCTINFFWVKQKTIFCSDTFPSEEFELTAST